MTVTDPEGQAGLDTLLARFEDADEPLDSTGAASVAQHIAEESASLDPQAEDPAMQIATAVATYLAYRRDSSPRSRAPCSSSPREPSSSATRPRACATGWPSAA